MTNRRNDEDEVEQWAIRFLNVVNQRGFDAAGKYFFRKVPKRQQTAVQKRLLPILDRLYPKVHPRRWTTANIFNTLH